MSPTASPSRTGPGADAGGAPPLRIGVDVGGTNTDAVAVAGDRVLARAKRPTTPDVTGGIVEAVRSVLAALGPPGAAGRGGRPGPDVAADPGGRPGTEVRTVTVGTTHFVNALLEGRGLARTAVLRLCGPATRLLPPLADWPRDLREAVGGSPYFLPGGHEFDGRELVPLDEEAVRSAVREARDRGAEAVALCGVFSPVNPAHEERAAALIAAEWPELHVTRSHEIGRIGLLERENAAALNAALSAVARRTVRGIREALGALGLGAPLRLTQNDGTVMDAAFALRYPVLAIASGPTNSMRGAALLAGLADALVVDVGGTTTDVGVLVRGFPREASTAVELAGVRTNFRMPDLLTLPVGGGSVVRGEEPAVGPESVGAGLTREALVFGGRTVTATDLAVAQGRVRIGDPERVRSLDPGTVARGLEGIRRRIEDAVDRVRLGPGPLPLIAVGGGGFLVEEPLAAVGEIVRPAHGEVANAVGAALARVGGRVETVYSQERESRARALERAREEARARAVQAGADPATVEIVEVEEVPLAYLPGTATRVRVVAVGDPAPGGSPDESPSRGPAGARLRGEVRGRRTEGR